jgi:hypothetical protein
MEEAKADDCMDAGGRATQEAKAEDYPEACLHVLAGLMPLAGFYASGGSVIKVVYR